MTDWLKHLEKYRREQLCIEREWTGKFNKSFPFQVNDTFTSDIANIYTNI